jgi:release factor glutamine methyltransferase
MRIEDIYKKYSAKIDHLDLELLIAAAIKKPREFVLAHPEHIFTKAQISRLKFQIARRARHEPLAYILGHKEFFGLSFKVTKDVLIPRPETELLVEKVLQFRPVNKNIIDIGTGCGNIIIALAKKLKYKNKLFAIDASEKSLSIAKRNAKFHGVYKKIKFLQGKFLDPLANEVLLDSIVIANLPYLSQKIYATVSADIKKYEPRSALLSRNNGLSHYKKLLEQINRSAFLDSGLSVFIEFSPEQKKGLHSLAQKLLPGSKISIHKDLSHRWRICQITFI